MSWRYSLAGSGLNQVLIAVHYQVYDKQRERGDWRVSKAKRRGEGTSVRHGEQIVLCSYLLNYQNNPFVDGNFLTTYILYRIFIKGIFMWDIICLEAKQQHINSVGCVSSILFSQQHAQPVKQCIGQSHTLSSLQRISCSQICHCTAQSVQVEESLLLTNCALILMYLKDDCSPINIS